MPSEVQPLLVAERICMSFGPVVALQDVSIRVEVGKVTCLLGDNGAGKSTLIKILSGVLSPASGEIRLAGKPVQVGDVRRPIMTLSGGERQSVAISRAIYFGAKLLILDEPTSALGVKEAEIVLSYVKRAKESGIGVVFITHNVHHAFLVGDTYEILKRGSVSVTLRKADVTPELLFAHMSGE